MATRQRTRRPGEDEAGPEDATPGGPGFLGKKVVFGRDPATFETQGPAKAVVASVQVLGLFDELHKIAKAGKCTYCSAPAVNGVLWADGRAIINVCDKHLEKAKHRVTVTNKDEVCCIRKLSSAMARRRPVPKKIDLKSETTEVTGPPTSVMYPNG